MAGDDFDNICFDKCNGTLTISFVASSYGGQLALPGSERDYRQPSYQANLGEIYLAGFTRDDHWYWGSYWGGAGSDFRCPLATSKTNRFFLSHEAQNTSGSSSYSYKDPGGGAYVDTTLNYFWPNGADAAENVMLPAFERVPIHLEFDTIVCINDSITFIPSIKGESYEWNTGEQTPTITKEIIDSNYYQSYITCMDIVDTVSWSVGIEDSIQTIDTIVCEGSRVPLLFPTSDLIISSEWENGVSEVLIKEAKTIRGQYKTSNYQCNIKTNINFSLEEEDSCNIFCIYSQCYRIQYFN